MYEPRPYPKFVKLHYSLKQLAMCKIGDPSFTPNKCDGKEYTEMRTGQTLQECNSHFKDAVPIFSGTIQEYNQLEKEGRLIYL